MAWRDLDIGAVSAYAIAVEHGYTGTEEEWANEQAAAGENARIAKESAKTAVAAAKAAQSNLDSIKPNTEQAIANIQTEGSTQRRSVTSTGDAQNQRVMDTGAEQSRALSAQGDVEQRKVIAAGDEQVSRVTNAGNGAVESVTLEKTNAVNSVQSTKVEAVNSVETAKTSAVEAVKSAESAAVQNIGTGVDDTLSISGKAADAKKTGDAISSLKDDLVDFNRVTEFGESNFIYDGYINNGYGFTPNSNFKTSEIVEIGNATSILCKYTSMDNLVNYLILDINGERVSSHIGTESTPTHIEEVIDFPPTAYKIQISKLKTSNDKFYLFGEKENNNSKKWLVVGDSITEGATNGNISYADYIKSELGISLIKEGHSGWSFSRLVQNFASFDTNNSADIITIFAGTNDFNESLGAGNESDIWTPTNNTIWALCNYFMPYIQNRYPTKPIIFFTPIQRKYHGEDTSSITTMTDENGVTLQEYAQAFIDAGKKYGIPVIDLYSMSGIGVSNIDAMTNDGLHPNEIGQKRIARLVKSEIKKYLLN